jgi:hypothetical protein
MATVFETITDLSEIVTDAITAGNANNIPARTIRNTLIRVSTGKYKEVLPIIVPAECCVIGDELRSTNVQPRTIYNDSNLTPKADFKYSFEALKQIENVVSDIVTGQAVTATTGNTELQDQTWPYAETAVVAPAVKTLTRNIRKNIDAALGTKQEAILPRAYELADVDFGNSRDLFLANKEFIQAEIIAYIADQYPNIKYSRTKCKQDVGFIMDAVAYDLSYGGNWQSINAGLAYFNGTNGVLQIAASEKAATLAAYGYLDTLLQTTGRAITVTPVYQTEVPQQLGVGGSATASTAIAGLFTDITTIIDQGPDNAPAITYPSTAGAAAGLVSDSNDIDAIKSTLQEQTIDFINANFGSFKYNSSKCRRDLTNIITDLAFDMALGTNYNATFNGIAYQRPNNAYNLNNQRIETIGAIRQARDLSIAELSDSTAISRLTNGFNEIVDIIQNGTLGTAMPGDGVVDALTFPNPAGVDQNRIDAKNNLQANIEFIKADVIAFIANNYGSLNYDSTKCARDVEYIINAQSYDILYGGTQATSRIAESYFKDGDIQVEGQTTETAAAYDHLASLMSQIVQEQSVTAQTGNVELQTTLGSPATATEGNEIQTNVELISDVIDGTTTLSAVLSATTYPSVTWAAAGLQTDKTTLDGARSQIILDTIQFITNTYNDFKYDHAKCSRDLGLIIDAARYDWMLDTNFASIVAAYSYLRQPSSKEIGDQKTATIAANQFAYNYIIDNNVLSEAAAITGLNTTWEWVQDIIWGGSSEGSNRQVEDIEVYNAVRMLELNKEFIVEEAIAHVEDYFQDTVTQTIDGASQLPAVQSVLTISDTSWLHPYMEIKFVDFPETTGNVNAGGVSSFTSEGDVQVYYVREILSATEFTISEQIGFPEASLADSTAPFRVTKSYTYNTDLCKRDVRAYIDAMKWDLVWPQEWKRSYTNDVTIYRTAFYKSKLAARYYVNSVIGSQEEDFYYMRNGSGLRLQTMDGLRGDLTAENEFGTSRVTAGAYSSLDPGWGPDDERVWITARSPYLQNNTTFGYAAVGQKIDGALHNGGNDSMVSNDFTQVISDGIGAWLTNNGRAEMVSVFTYYSYIGYLCESGGRARATNGNNSYGTYGSVAEGVDPDENPVTAIVDNRTQYSATFATVNTDQNQLLDFEFNHAGNEYTKAEVLIFGAGDNEVVVADEFRDNAVFQVRIDESTPDTAGGSGYTVVENTAQAGSATGIFLAATDGNASSAYPGMRIQIISGAGTGLFATIDTYDSGTKEVTVVKDSDGTAGWDHIVPGTTFEAPNSTSTYLIEPRVEFSAPPQSDTSVTLNSAITAACADYIAVSNQYVGVATVTESDGGGATFDVTKNGSKYLLDLNDGGSGYKRLDTVTIPGTSLGGASPLNDIVITISTINDATGAIVDFDFTGYGQKGYFVVLPATNGDGQISVDGITWSALNMPDPGVGNQWDNIASGLIDDGSSNFYQSAAIAVAQGGSLAAITTDGETWTGSNLPGAFSTSGATDIAFLQVSNSIGRFAAISNNDTDIIYSDNGGASWITIATALDNTGYSCLAAGLGLYVTLRANSTNTMWSSDALTWNAGSGLVSAAWTDIAYGDGRFVAMASDGTGAYSIDGKNWTQNDFPNQGAATYTQITYGQGVFVATRTDNTYVYSEDGIYWQSYTPSVAISGPITFGNPDKLGKFIVFDDASNASAIDLRLGARARGRASVANEQIFEIKLTEPGSNYVSGDPTCTIIDPNNINDVELDVRVGNGVLGQPSFVARGNNFTSASAEIAEEGSDGFADFLQSGAYIAVRRLSALPVNGSNVVFDHLPGRVFKLVNTVSFLGTNDGSYTAFLQLSPSFEIPEAPADGTDLNLRIRFSQVRLTGHDFLDIGTGNFADTNYPGVPVNAPDQAKETVDNDGGRVFFTATDQDGNFRVGDLFSIEQATGVATLNAEAFNIAGLQELSLGEVTLGGNSASISEFSTDPFFTANSDTVVPTQRAVKAYIEAQIGGGGASLNVNSVTAGDIFINTNQITTVSGQQINIKANVVFQGAVLGTPLAYNYFLRG